MFMQVALGAIGIGVVLMVAYIVISQVRSALPATASIQEVNPCLGQIGDTTPAGECAVNAANDTWTAASVCGTENLTGFNDTGLITCENVGYASGTSAVQATVFAGFGLIAVGNVFQMQNSQIWRGAIF